MKKFSLLLTLAIMMVGSTVFAGSLDYLSNQSAKYCANTASTARTDGADIVAYNPAGTALMGQGLFIDVSNQTLLKYYTAKEDAMLADEYKQSEPTLLLPNVYAVYNFGQMGMGKLAAFAQAGIIGGGGTLKWDDGTVGSNIFAVSKAPALQAGVSALVGGVTTFTGYKTALEASSVYYSFGGGVAYSLLEDMISVSAGAKYVMARRTGKVTGTMNFSNPNVGGAFAVTIADEYEYEADGITPVFGFDAKPMKELTIGVRYEMETDLEFEYTQKDKTSTNTLSNATLKSTVESLLPDYTDVKANQNLPQILSLGAEYVVMPELTVGVTGTMYFMSKADLGGYEEAYGTGYEVALGATYKVMEPLKIAASVMYTDQAVKAEYLEDDTELLTTSANPILNSIFMGFGATYTVIPNLDLTCAVSWVHYLPEDVTTDAGLEINYKKEVYNIAIGASYKM